MIGVDELGRRLRRFRRIGADQYQACCPVHGDDTPSLSIKITPGRILLHCHAGCPTGEILARLGLRWADLFAVRKPDPDESWMAVGASRGVAARGGAHDG